MGDLERLVAIEAIKQVKTRCFRLLDTRDWNAFEHVFAEDAVMDDHAFWPQGELGRKLHGWGYQHETYVREGGEWRIASGRFVGSRTEMQRA